MKTGLPELRRGRRKNWPEKMNGEHQVKAHGLVSPNMYLVCRGSAPVGRDREPKGQKKTLRGTVRTPVKREVTDGYGGAGQ